ncbi:RNA polymerase sigma-70 factor [Sphingobacterium sp. BIGb0165]|uniref:RNA polymerase sigma-70 factor n=1 Tax=Sphingobacterium sp. BIGb0165 TaxID=2940615 RepID=UPI00216A87EE|nr:RNA polymerase sigma-70 factor [Sphingobacterium sp. BIGb0165]MCS4226967.1 RNA polymerase sigma-70 factor (ECF subfamily) [Sphingobacterium sp. BIGb0165]
MIDLKTYADDELTTLMIEGDHNAFTEIYKRYWKRLFHIASLRLNDPEEAEEVVQNIFVSLWDRREKLEITTSINAYLAISVKYRIIKVLDKHYNQQKYVESMTASILDDSTQQWLEFLDLKDILEKTITDLPEKCQLVFRMSRDRHMSQKEIASELNISQKTVEAHLGKAIKTLRNKLNRFFMLLL